MLDPWASDPPDFLDYLATQLPADANAVLRRAKRHDVYQALAEHASLTNIMQLRQKLAARSPEFAGPLAELRLLRVLALTVGSWRMRRRAPRNATLQDKRKTLVAVRKLMPLLIPGANLPDFFEATRLHSSLQKLKDHLAHEVVLLEGTKRRGARGGEDAAQRYWLLALSRELLLHFGSAPTSIVSEGAGMMGFEPAAKSLKRYVDTALRHVDPQIIVMVRSAGQLNLKIAG